ncbi:MAG TPA: TRAP transporter substrate-binding protein [Hyphomicrobiaceae bacterium]|jgi:TRAP-type C4-dicarboxylate transport system substrate-binding protein
MRRCVVVAVAAVSTAVLWCAAAAAADPTAKISFSIWQSPDHYMVKGIQRWASEIGKRTNGKVEFVFYHGGTLTKGPQAYDGMVKGISDAAAAATGWTPGRFPLTRITDVPLGWASSRQASLVSWEFYKKFRPKEWNEAHLLFLYTDAIGNIHTKKPVRSIDDLKGMQIRGTGNDVPLIRAMGGTPVGTAWSEVYLALQRGVADGLISNYASYKASKLAEVTRYTTDHNVRSVGFWVAMNKKKWEGLPRDAQKVIDEVSEQAVGWLGETLDAEQEDGRKYVLASGNEIIVPTTAEAARFDEALRPTRDDWVKETEALGLPGKNVLEFVLKAMEKYQGH